MHVYLDLRVLLNKRACRTSMIQMDMCKQYRADVSHGNAMRGNLCIEGAQGCRGTGIDEGRATIAFKQTGRHQVLLAQVLKVEHRRSRCNLDCRSETQGPPFQLKEFHKNRKNGR